jgi:hypothetical protein
MRIWDAVTGRLADTFTGYGDEVSAVAVGREVRVAGPAGGTCFIMS